MLLLMPCRSKDTLRQFAALLKEHGGELNQALEVMVAVSARVL